MEIVLSCRVLVGGQAGHMPPVRYLLSFFILVNSYVTVRVNMIALVASVSYCGVEELVPASRCM